MRIRSIKPEFWRSPDVAELSIEDRLLWIGLWSYVDDNGVGKDRAPVIAADLFAFDLATDAPETLARVSRGLQNLSEGGRITRYTIDGEHWLCVNNWSRHQRIDKPNKARYPSPASANAEIRESVAEPSRDLRETPAPGTEEQGNRGTEEQSLLVIPDGPTERDSMSKKFDDWWGHWPKKVRKKQARDAFPDAVKTLPLPALIEATDKWVAAFNATGNDRKFIPDPDRWLKHQRWEDELPTTTQQAPAFDPKNWKV